jgi:hypothetical protein
MPKPTTLIGIVNDEQLREIAEHVEGELTAAIQDAV